MTWSQFEALDERDRTLMLAHAKRRADDAAKARDQWKDALVDKKAYTPEAAILLHILTRLTT